MLLLLSTPFKTSTIKYTPFGSQKQSEKINRSDIVWIQNSSNCWMQAGLVKLLNGRWKKNNLTQYYRFAIMAGWIKKNVKAGKHFGKSATYVLEPNNISAHVSKPHSDLAYLLALAPPLLMLKQQVSLQSDGQWTTFEGTVAIVQGWH